MPHTLEHKPLGQLLLGRGLLAAAQLDGALDEQRRGRGRKLLGEILVESRLCTEEQVAESLAESYGVPFARVSPRVADPKAIGVLPRQFLEREQVLPLFVVEGVLTVAVAEPGNVFLLDEIARLCRLKVQPVAATAGDIAATLRAYLPDGRAYAIEASAPHVDPDHFAVVPRPAVPRADFADRRPSPAATTADGQGAAVDRLVNACLFNAINESATDIHVEPAEDHLRIRYRIDGRLIERFRPPPQTHAPLVARLKEMAGLDPERRRIPQEGTIPVRVDRRSVELRVTFAPAAHGEKAVIRLRGGAKSPPRLEKLGFDYDTLKQWRKLIDSPGGLLLVTGPAGSGKKATLYATVRELDVDQQNVCSVEDPLDQVLAGVSQYQPDGAGFDRDAALRAALGHDPDVLMVPDLAEANDARRLAGAALGGCKVMASLHAPDAAGAIARLLSLGVEPYVLHAALAGVLSQRLVRRLCQECREAYEPTDAERKWIDKRAGTLTTLFRAHAGGCGRCGGSGYAGRIGLYELLVPDDAVTQAIVRAAGLPELRESVRRCGAKSLRTDAFDKLKSGVTTVAELTRTLL